MAGTTAPRVAAQDIEAPEAEGPEPAARDGAWPGTTAPNAATIDARVLGEFAFEVGGRVLTPADWQRVSAERLVKLLLVTPGHRLSREVAAETLWPDAGPGLARADLRKAILFARRALGSGDLLRADARWLKLDRSRLGLDLDRLVDALDVLGAGGSALEPIEPAEDLEVSARPLSEREAAALEQAVRLGWRPLLPDDAYERLARRTARTTPEPLAASRAGRRSPRLRARPPRGSA